MVDYNEQRPHDALQGLTPTAYRKKICAGDSNLELCA
jgi:transposase InsO family protein